MKYVGTAMLWVLVVTFAVASLLSLYALGAIWIWSRPAVEFPHLPTFLAAFLLEAAPVAILVARERIRRAGSRAPATLVCKDARDFDAFMAGFLKNASSATIFSNRLKWVTQSTHSQAVLTEWARRGNTLRIITAQTPQCAALLRAAGVHLDLLADQSAPAARFTLTDPDRQGATRLAIALGAFPDHVVHVYDKDSGPHLIALALELVKRAATN